MAEHQAIFLASVGDIYGPKFLKKPVLRNKMSHLNEDIVSIFLNTLNKSDPQEIQNVIQMVCSNLNNRSNIPTLTCDHLLYGQPVARSYGAAGDMMFTDVEVPHTSTVILVLLFSLELLFSLLGNSMVLFIFTCSRQMRSITNFFIVSLAASDLLVTFSSLPLNIAQVLTGFWQFGSAVCRLGPFTGQLSVAASSLTLCCIAFDRYIAVVHPLQLSTMQNPRRAALLMTAVWLVALGSAAPFAYYHHLLKVCQWPSGDCALYCGMPSSLQWIHWLTYVVLLLVPMCLMGVSYAIIIFKLWLRQPVGTTVVNVESLRMQYKKKAIKMLFLVMVIFTSCWMPLLTFDLLAKLLHSPLSQNLVTLRYYLQCLALSATCLNPMVYAIMHDKFRRNFNKFSRFCPCPTGTRVTPLPPAPAPLPRGGRHIPRPATSIVSEAKSSAPRENGNGRVFHVELSPQTWVEKFEHQKDETS
ncbi:hypothetical protein V1264_011703 [Littorina saxatilis]|uniref:G-protein coupled receptors family 1 profile domain-containing protein n=1 Tax=Littorina saxatilis TaxID=31220 RepID=A0AAN9GL81_9CAEN